MPDTSRRVGPSLRVALLGLGLFSSACVQVRSSSVAVGGEHGAYQGKVEMVALGPRDAPGELVAHVQATGSGDGANIELLAPELRKQAAENGGDLVLVDHINSHFDIVQQVYSYNCGTAQAPATCSGVRSVEVQTTQMLGRAFKRFP